MEEGDSHALALAVQDVRHAQGSGAGGSKPLILNFPFNGLVDSAMERAPGQRLLQ